MRATDDSIVRMPRRRLFSAIDMHAAAIGTIAAAVLIVGWGFRVELLQSIIPGFPIMRPGAALAFMMLSLSCLLSLRGSRRSRLASGAVAVAAIVWALWLAVSNWGAGDNEGTPAAPVQATLLSLMLGGVAMLIINQPTKRGALVGAIAIAASAPALFRIFDLILFWGAPSDRDDFLSSMALHTAILIVWFMLACVIMHPRTGLGDTLSEASVRGRLLRRTLPVVVLLPVAAGAFSLVLSQLLSWNLEVLFALTAALSAAVSVVLVWWLSRLVVGWQTESNERANLLARANEALEQYASSAAHDLKAPARHVIIFGELMREAMARGDAATAERMALKVQSAAAGMPAIIDGMLEFSRSGFKRIRPAACTLGELVQSAAAQLDADIRNANARIALEHDADLFCDHELMTTVLQNLIANSLAQGRGNRPLLIRIDAGRSPDGWRLTIDDNGPGFDPAFAVLAFNPLARGSKRVGDGLGIGLATCRRIIEGHGGHIRVDPGYRDGARIEILLMDPPAAPARTDAAAARPAPA